MSRVHLAGFSNVLAASGVPAFITDVDVADKDITLPVVALDDKRVLYSFGKNFGEAHVMGIIFIFGCNRVTDALAGMQNAFNAYRVSSALSPINLSIIGSGGYRVYPVQLKFSNAESKRQFIMFTVSCILAPVSNK